MSIKISGGVQDSGVVVGNTYDKYGSGNPVVRWIMKNFDFALSDLVAESSPNTIHEVGCGEGYWVMRWSEQGYRAIGSDFSNHVIDIAKENAVNRSFPDSIFKVRSIYDLRPDDSADLVVCCEVLEHLQSPHAGLKALQKIVDKHLIVSVPMEPLWRLLNMARGKYIANLGNTPGHVQHWSKKSFVNLTSKYFDILHIKCPMPWTMLLCQPLR